MSEMADTMALIRLATLAIVALVLGLFVLRPIFSGQALPANATEDLEEWNASVRPNDGMDDGASAFTLQSGGLASIGAGGTIDGDFLLDIGPFSTGAGL